MINVYPVQRELIYHGSLFWNDNGTAKYPLVSFSILVLCFFFLFLLFILFINLIILAHQPLNNSTTSLLLYHYSHLSNHQSLFTDTFPNQHHNSICRSIALVAIPAAGRRAYVAAVGPPTGKVSQFSETA